jgi:hypothetical protein
MQSHSDSHDAGMTRHFRLRTVEQMGCDALSPELPKDIQVLNLRNVQLRESRIGRSPIHRHLSRKPPINNGNEARSGASHLLAQILPVLRFRFIPTHLREGGSDDNRIVFIQRPNREVLRVVHTQYFMPMRT